MTIKVHPPRKSQLVEARRLIKQAAAPWPVQVEIEIGPNLLATIKIGSSEGAMLELRGESGYASHEQALTSMECPADTLLRALSPDDLVIDIEAAHDGILKINETDIPARHRQCSWRRCLDQESTSTLVTEQMQSIVHRVATFGPTILCDSQYAIVPSQRGFAVGRIDDHSRQELRAITGSFIKSRDPTWVQTSEEIWTIDGPLTARAEVRSPTEQERAIADVARQSFAIRDSGSICPIDKEFKGVMKNLEVRRSRGVLGGCRYLATMAPNIRLIVEMVP